MAVPPYSGVIKEHFTSLREQVRSTSKLLAHDSINHIKSKLSYLNIHAAYFSDHALKGIEPKKCKLTHEYTYVNELQ